MGRKLNELLADRFSSPKVIAVFFACLAFVLRFPFLFRYDNHFGGDSAIGYVMALDLLKGDHVLFFGGADYVSTVEFYLMSFVFKIFGPSIPLGGFIMLLEWSVAVGIGVYLFIQSTSKLQGSFAGWVAVVGVPYTMTYTTVPADSIFILLSMILLLEAYLIIEKGDSFLRFLIFGFTMGASFFISKKCFPAMVTCGLVMVCVSNSVWQLKRLFKHSVFVPFVLAALVGCSPEIWYKLYHPTLINVFGFVAWNHLNDNFQNVLKCSLAYFDAQASSRMQDAFYYWMHLGDLQNDPHGIGDHFCFWISRLVLMFVCVYTFISFFKKRPGLVLLGGFIIINILMMCASNHVVLNDNNLPRRYLLPIAVPLSLWTGFFFAKCFEAKWKYSYYLALVLMCLFLGRCLFHNYVLLTAPDDLREVRWLVTDIEDHHIDRGLTNFGLDYQVMGLTNEKIIIAEPVEHKLVSADKQKLVAKSDEIAVIGSTGQPVEKRVTVEFSSGHRIYRIAGDIHKSKSLWWAPYQAVGPPTD